MNIRLILSSIVAALAGFLFGFDTVVISGAEKTIEKLWDLISRLMFSATCGEVVELV